MADYMSVPSEERENIREMDERQATSNTETFEEPKLSKEDWAEVESKVDEGLSYSEAIDEVKVDKLIKDGERDGGTDPLLVIIKEWPQLPKYKKNPELIPSLEYQIGRLTEIILKRDKKKDKEKKKYENKVFRDKKALSRPTLLHLAAEQDFLQVSKMLVEHFRKSMYVLTSEGTDSVLPVQLALGRTGKFNDDTASYLISEMQYDRVQELFLRSEGKKSKDPCFAEIISYRDPKTKKCGMKKTVTAVLNKLIDPHWPHLPNRKDRNDDEKDKITKALESMPNYPLDYDFYFHILETDDNGEVPGGQNFNEKSVSCLRHIADCGVDNKEAVQHPVVRMLVARKWNKFGFWWFRLEAALYGLFFAVLSFALIYGSTRDHPTRYEGPADKFRALCEICSIIFLMVQIAQMIKEIAREKSLYFDFFNRINIFGIIFILLVIPLRIVFEESTYQWLVAAIGYFLCFIHLFKYSNVSRITAFYTTTIVKMIMEDVKRFMVFFAVIFIGFCGTMFLALKVDGAQDSYSFPSIMLAGFKALVGQGTLEEDDGKKFGWLASAVILVYMGTLTVMLLNILIAQFGFTYSEAKKTARLQYAADIMRIVTRLEYSRFPRWNYRVNNYKRGSFISDEDLAKEMLENTEGRHPWETNEERIGSVREEMKRVVKTGRDKEGDPWETIDEKLTSLASSEKETGESICEKLAVIMEKLEIKQSKS